MTARVNRWGLCLAGLVFGLTAGAWIVYVQQHELLATARWDAALGRHPESVAALERLATQAPWTVGFPGLARQELSRVLQVQAERLIGDHQFPAARQLLLRLAREPVSADVRALALQRAAELPDRHLDYCRLLLAERRLAEAREQLELVVSTCGVPEVARQASALLPAARGRSQPPSVDRGACSRHMPSALAAAASSSALVRPGRQAGSRSDSTRRVPGAEPFLRQPLQLAGVRLPVRLQGV